MVYYGRGSTVRYSRGRGAYGKYGALRLKRSATKISTAKMARSAYQGVKRMKRLINVEEFILDTGVTGSAVNSTGFTYNFTAIANGDGQGARTGNSILVKSVRVKGVFKINVLATCSDVRIIIFRDKQQVADTDPTIGQVLDTTGEPVALPSDLTTGRFEILSDGHFWLGSTSQQGQCFDFEIPVNKHARYNGTATSDIQMGGVYMLCVSNEVTNSVSMVWQGRTVYFDN